MKPTRARHARNKAEARPEPEAQPEPSRIEASILVVAATKALTRS